MRKGLIGLAIGAALGVASITGVYAKITPPQDYCVNGGGNQASGQQPDCKGSGQTAIDEPAKNPAGNVPPGQN
jgi:hypothetical protein